MRRLILSLAVALASPAATAAEPDFAASRIEYAPSPATAGDVVRYDATLTNSGASSPYARVTVALPRGFFVGAAGDCARAAYDADRHRLVWHEGPFPRGDRRHCTVELLTLRDAAGAIASLAVEVNAPPGFYRRLDAGPELQSPPDPHAVPFGPVKVTRAGLAVLGVLAVFALGAAWLHRRAARPRDAIRAWGAVVVALGFLFYFALLALGDLAAFTRYRETTCRVLDSTLRATPSRNATTYQPLFALRYVVDGAVLHAAGHASPTTLSLGWLGPSDAARVRFAIGSEHSCWYDPDDPRTVLLVRGPGGAYLFALFPLPVLALGLMLLRQALGPPRRG